MVTPELHVTRLIVHRGNRCAKYLLTYPVIFASDPEFSLSPPPTTFFSKSQRTTRVSCPDFRFRNLSYSWLKEAAHTPLPRIITRADVRFSVPLRLGIYCLTHSLPADPLPISTVAEKSSSSSFECKNFQVPVLDLSSFSLPPPCSGKFTSGTRNWDTPTITVAALCLLFDVLSTLFTSVPRSPFPPSRREPSQLTKVSDP